jgi:hypothetical protein
MTINFSCACGRKLSAPDELAGKQAKCPTCSSIVNVPLTSQAPGEPPTLGLAPSAAPQQPSAPYAAQPVGYNPQGYAAQTPPPPQYAPQYQQTGYPGAPPYPGAVAQQKTSGMAIASLISSFFCGPAGIILGFVALSQIKSNPQLTGKGLAIAGIILGFAGILFGIIYGIAVAAMAHNMG